VDSRERRAHLPGPTVTYPCNVPRTTIEP
jgi:hypothetical protein